MAKAARTSLVARGAETRRRIIEGAWNLIAERGLHALTTRLVAREAGISHGMCHYHFANKDDMILAVVDYERRFWIDPMESLVGGSGTPGQKLDRVISWMAEPATRDVMRVHLELVSHSEWDENLRARMAAEYERWQAAYVRLFQELKGAGLLRPEVDEVRIGVAFATLADSLVDQQSLNPELDTEAVMRAFLAPLLRASTP